jgi:hypothetical protein
VVRRPSAAAGPVAWSGVRNVCSYRPGGPAANLNPLGGNTNARCGLYTLPVILSFMGIDDAVNTDLGTKLCC